MKVALIYDFFPHYRAAVLRELLHSSEHDYLLVADSRGIEGTIKVWEPSDQTRFVHAPCRKFISSFYLQKGLLNLALRKDIKALIFLANPYVLSIWLAALAGKLAGKRVFFWTHGWIRDETGVKAWLRSVFYKLPHGLLLYGHFAKMHGLASGFPKEKLHVIYNSLDYSDQRAIRESLPPQDPQVVRAELFERADIPMVMCSARLIRTCRFDLLLEAQAQLRDEGHLINVLLVGDGPEKARLEAQAAALNLPVNFFGACYDETTLARLSTAAHVTVSPGKVGLTAIQSLAYGTPVITHDDRSAQGPEWEAITPGRTGALFRSGDAGDLAKTIKKWTSGAPPSPQIRAECYKILERFYNAKFQCRAIDRAVSGAAADDLFWLREHLEAA